MKEVYVISALRTPIGSFGGALKDISAPELGAQVIKQILTTTAIDPKQVNEVLMGCVLQAALGQAPAKQAAKKGGIPDFVPCTTVNKVCASGMKAIMQGAQSILLGDADIIIAGGMESMSNVPYYSPSSRWGNKFGNINLLDGIAYDGLMDAYSRELMGNFADSCGKDCNITREEQDAFAIESYKRSQDAWNSGRFSDEVIPVEIPQRKGETVTFSKDEEPWNVRFDKVASLKPAFNSNGTVTAANASTMNDGAAAVLLASGEKVKELNLTPVARIVSYADAEQSPEWFTTSPSLSLPKAAKKAGLKITDLDFIELNEAFSVVGIVNSQRMELDPSKVNVNGGAVSLGHPLGCSGARIIVTLINVLKQNNGKIGGSGICNGGGGASSVIIELV